MKIFSLAALGSQILIIAGFWAWCHINAPMGNQLAGTSIEKFLAYGRLAGLLAALGVLLQLMLIGRIRWVERAFGLDRLSRLHHVTGFSLLLLLVAHPVLVTAGHAAQADVPFLVQLVDFIKKWEDVDDAVLAFGLIVAATVFSVFILLKRVRYEVWYATHLILYVALALAIGHQLESGMDFNRPALAWIKAYWIALYVFVFANLIVYRFVRPLRMFFRHRFAVVRVVPETGDVNSVYIGGRGFDGFRIEAGQFMIVRFLAKGFRWEAHPFSMSCTPDGRQIRLTIKALGDFTKRIPDLKPGTPVLVDGPHGVFIASRCRTAKVLMIAGGIGITPLRSIVPDLLAMGRDVVLIYGSRRHDAIVFGAELADIEAGSSGRFRVINVMSDDQDWEGEKGRVDAGKIGRLVPDLKERDIYLCGPPAMMDLVRKGLIELDVAESMLHYENFKL